MSGRTGEGRSARRRPAVDPALVESESSRRAPAQGHPLANLPAGERSWRGEREASEDERRRAEPLDRFEAAIVFAMREAMRVQREPETQHETREPEDRSE